MAEIGISTWSLPRVRMAIARRREDGWVTPSHGSWERLHERGLSIALERAAYVSQASPSQSAFDSLLVIS